jgi:hypothetical protein
MDTWSRGRARLRLASVDFRAADSTILAPKPDHQFLAVEIILL